MMQRSLTEASETHDTSIASQSEKTQIHQRIHLAKFKI
jgi:hypothetical protein